MADTYEKNFLVKFLSSRLKTKVRIIGDGNCLFRAFSKSIEKTEINHEKYRKTAATYMKDHPKEFEEFLLDEEKEGDRWGEYLKNLIVVRGPNTVWGGQMEINALAKALKRSVVALDSGNSRNVHFYYYPGLEHLGLESDVNVTYLLFTAVPGQDASKRNGHYDLLLEPQQEQTANGESDRLTFKTDGNGGDDPLIQKLKAAEEELSRFFAGPASAPNSNRFQTSFLKQDTLDVRALLNDHKEVKTTLELVADIVRQTDLLHRSDAAGQLIYDILCDLQPAEVIGDAEKSLFKGNVMVFALNAIAWLIYYPIMFIMMLLLMLGRIAGWITLIVGFTGALISSVGLSQVNLPMESTQGNSTLSNSTLGLSQGNSTQIIENSQDNSSVDSTTWIIASQVLGVLTGVLSAAKGVTLETSGKTDYLYRRPEDLTIEVLRETWGQISHEAVFQATADTKSIQEFRMKLREKKGDIRKVQDVRIFIAMVLSVSLVQTEAGVAYFERLKAVSERVENALIDPYNYIAMRDLESNGNEAKYQIMPDDIKDVKKLWRLIMPEPVFCLFIKDLHKGNVSFDRNGEKMLNYPPGNASDDSAAPENRSVRKTWFWQPILDSIFKSKNDNSPGTEETAAETVGGVSSGLQRDQNSKNDNIPGTEETAAKTVGDVSSGLQRDQPIVDDEEFGSKEINV